MKNNKGIIFASDILEKTKLLNTIEEVAPFVEAIKIGNIILYEHGWKIATEIKEITDMPIIADLKLMDIPETAETITKSALEAGVDGVMVCGTSGRDTVSACMEIMGEKMVFVFTEFTHCGGLIDEEMANYYIDNIAMPLGCSGIQVPGTKEERIREVRSKVGSNLIIICCGIGSQYSCDEKSTITKFGSAIAAGADYEIIGRAIYKASVPKEAAMLAQSKIKEVLN